MITETYTLAIDYGKSLEDVIKEGNYDYVYQDINEKNLGKPDENRKFEWEVRIFNFAESVSSEEAVARMKEAGFRPANHFELAALGAAKPEVQWKKIIVALGSSWVDPYGDAHVAYLYGDSGGRGLNLGGWGGDWHGRYWFLGVRHVYEPLEKPDLLLEEIPAEVIIAASTFALYCLDEKVNTLTINTMAGKVTFKSGV